MWDTMWARLRSHLSKTYPLLLQGQEVGSKDGGKFQSMFVCHETAPGNDMLTIAWQNPAKWELSAFLGNCLLSMLNVQHCCFQRGTALWVSASVSDFVERSKWYPPKRSLRPWSFIWKLLQVLPQAYCLLHVWYGQIVLSEVTVGKSSSL
jgi:hypothetical protein